MSEYIERIAEEITDDARDATPVDKGAFERRYRTGSLGVPVWLHDLLERADWDSQVLAIEIGGRGVLHPRVGWVSIEELREVAHD